MKAIKFLSLLLVSFLSFSCCDQTKFEDHTWKLVELNGEENEVFEDGDFFTLMFIEAEGKISGAGACNRFFGTYEQGEGSDLDLKMGGATMMAGPNMEFEQVYFDALEAADNYKIKKGILSLNAGEETVLKFKVFTTEE